MPRVASWTLRTVCSEDRLPTRVFDFKITLSQTWATANGANQVPTGCFNGTRTFSPKAPANVLFFLLKNCCKIQLLISSTPHLLLLASSTSTFYITYIIYSTIFFTSPTSSTSTSSKFHTLSASSKGTSHRHISYQCHFHMSSYSEVFTQEFFDTHCYTQELLYRSCYTGVS